AAEAWDEAVSVCGGRGVSGGCGAPEISAGVQHAGEAGAATRGFAVSLSEEVKAFLQMFSSDGPHSFRDQQLSGWSVCSCSPNCWRIALSRIPGADSLEAIVSKRPRFGR